MTYPRLILLTLFAILRFGLASGSISICSWNLLDLGNSKNETEIAFIASTLQPFDVIAIQEVVVGEGGTKAIVRLVERMNHNGKSWDYTISNPTVSSTYKTECYAFIWNKTIVEKIGTAWLDHNYEVEIDREPYFATFKKDGSIFTVVNFHAKTKSKQPETDIKYFKYFPTLYPKLNLIFCGDFNCPQSHSVFNPLKSMGYKPALIGQKTTLRMKCLRNDCLASEFDNLFYHPQKIRFIRSGVVHFYHSFQTMEKARKISDHLPIYLTFN
jgi:endonuclease/exonuclease/phosphatase family metal-dependent hydrolase